MHTDISDVARLVLNGVNWSGDGFPESGRRWLSCHFYLADAGRRGANMNWNVLMGPWIIRPSVFYCSYGRGQRAQVFSEEVNAKLNFLSAETGGWDRFIKMAVNHCLS